jgi:hypothetical protein
MEPRDDTPPPERAARPVFISHSSSDAPVAQRLCAALEAMGCRCWIAPRDIPPGSSWVEGIATGVEGSLAVAVLLTQASMASQHLLREVELAIAKGVPVVPVRLDTTPLAAGLQYLLSSVQWIDVAGDPPDVQAAKLRAAIEGKPTVTRPQHNGLGRRAAWVAAGAAVLAAVAAGPEVARRRNPPDGFIRAPDPISLGSEAAGLPFGSLLETVWTGAPPAAGTIRPALQFEILAQRQGSDSLVSVRDGDPLRSQVDLYVLTAGPTTPGHLYVFQIDSSGAVYWLFPRNATCEESTGINPVAPGRIEIPGAGRGLMLDNVTGDERVCAVFSNARWPELEERLAAAASNEPAGRPMPQTLLASRTRGVGGSRPLTQAQPPVRLGEREFAVPVTPVLLHEANGSMLVIDRWFQHE